MEVVLRIILGFIFAVILHELTHLLVIVYYNVPLKAVVFTKWAAFGFLIDNEDYVNDSKILILLHFLPLIWCLMIFFNPNDPFFVMFLLANIFGGMGDIYHFFRLILVSPQKRVEWVQKNDEKILRSIIWKREI